MAAYIRLTTTNSPDPVAVLSAIKSATGDATAVLVSNRDGSWKGKKAAAWSAAEVNAAQTILDTTASVTAQLTAQRQIDGVSIEMKAIVLTLVDALNVVRANLPTPLPPITPAQAIAAIRAKAGTL